MRGILHAMQPAAAFTRLLPWISGEPVPDGRLRRDLARFLRSFDGSPVAGGVRVAYGGAELDLLGDDRRALPRRPPPGIAHATWRAIRTSSRPVTPATINRLRRRLRALINAGFPGAPPSGARLQLTRLAVGVIARPTTKRSALRRRERRALAAYELLLDGPLPDLLAYCTAVTLATSGLTLVRCSAPAPRDWDRQCGRLFALLPGRRGRPRTYCSLACRVRAHAQRHSGRRSQ
jgi:hypothetical protein